MIVLLQLVVLRRIDGHRRTRIIMVMSLVWAIAWLTLGASGLLPGTLGATVLVAACTSIFAFGETLMQPTIPPLVNDLAPDHLRGRYNAVSTGAFSLAAIIAPVTAGWLIGHGASSLYIWQLVAGCGVVALVALRLERSLPHGANGVRAPEPEKQPVT